MNQRVSVKNVILGISTPSGTKQTVTLPGDQNDGLFFTNRAVNKILAPFYNTYEQYFTGESIKENLGSHATRLISGKERLRITPQLVEDFWNNKDHNGITPPFMIKIPPCTFRVPGMDVSGTFTGRPKVTGIWVELSYPNGSETCIALNPNDVEALVWSDNTVLNILAPFYDLYESILTREKLFNNCGYNALPTMKGKEQIRITPQFVEDIWHLHDSNDLLPPFLIKRPPCIIATPDLYTNEIIKAA